MKGGKTPIHFMRWACSDFVNDPWVKLALSRADTDAVTFYFLFLNHSFMEGGYLPADAKLLGGVLTLPAKVVEKALAYWTAKACGLIRIKGDRAWNPRVLRDVSKELAFRRKQATEGKKGGRPKKGSGKGSVSEPESPPSPSPSPAPSPSPSPSPSPAPAPRPSPGKGAKREPSPANGSPLAAAGDCGDWMDHDHGNLDECALVRRCQQLADMVTADDPEIDQRTARLDVFAAVTATTGRNGQPSKSLTTLRDAPPAWVQQSLRACDDFERDHTPADPAKEG